MIQGASADGFLDGLFLGLIAGIGFVVTMQASRSFFEGRPLKLYLTNTGYPVLVFAIAGGILGLWQ